MEDHAYQRTTDEITSYAYGPFQYNEQINIFPTSNGFVARSVNCFCERTLWVLCLWILHLLCFSLLVRRSSPQIKQRRSLPVWGTLLRIAFCFCSCTHISGWTQNILHLNLISYLFHLRKLQRSCVLPSLVHLPPPVFMAGSAWLWANASSSLACCGVCWSEVPVPLCSSLWCLSFFLELASLDISNSLQEKNLSTSTRGSFSLYYFHDYLFSSTILWPAQAFNVGFFIASLYVNLDSINLL